MKLLTVAIVILLSAIAGMMAYGLHTAADRGSTATSEVPHATENLAVCKQIIAEAGAGSDGTAKETFGRYASEGLDTCRTLVDLYELD